MSYDMIPTQPSRALLYNFGVNRTGHSIINETLKYTSTSIHDICERDLDRGYSQSSGGPANSEVESDNHMCTRRRGASHLCPHLRTSRFRYL